MRRVAVVLVVVLIWALADVSVVAAQAPAAVPITACGQIITTDAVLRTDLTCPGTALRIEASGVTVDLRHHHITSSDGTGIGVVYGFSPIDAFPGQCVQDVTVQGGTISGFLGGLGGECSTSTGDVAAGVTLTDNTWGLYIDDGFPPELRHSTIVGPNGIGPDGEPGSFRVSGSTIEVTAPEGHLLVEDGEGCDNLIDSSRLVNGRLVAAGGCDPTISNSRLEDVSMGCGDTNITVTDSVLVDSPISGEACGLTISGDQLIGPGTGTAVDNGGWSSSMTGNLFTGWDTAVVWRYDGRNITVSGNTFRGNGTGFLNTGPSCAWCVDGTITRNRFLDNSGSGLVLGSGTWNVGSNLALRNGGLGIDAEPSGSNPLTVLDLGGDVARGNQPPQCIGVVCTSFG